MTKTKNTTQLAALSIRPDDNGMIQYETILGYRRHGFIDFDEISQEGKVMLTDSETGESFEVGFITDEDIFIEL